MSDFAPSQNFGFDWDTEIVSAWLVSVVTDVKVVDGPGLLSTESGNK